MSLPNMQTALPVHPVESVDGTDRSTGGQSLEEAARARLAEALETVAESDDPVAALETAIDDVARDLGPNDEPAGAPEGPVVLPGEIEGAIGALVQAALEADDPVAALEEGAETLAEALEARDLAIQEWAQAAQEQQLDQMAAYRHARLHRVTELLDVGYSLDQAVAITNANEAEIRARAAAAGRNPMEPIYEYAVLNGYRGTASGRSAYEACGCSSCSEGQADRGGESAAIEALAQLGDEAFADATSGARWEKLMRP